MTTFEQLCFQAIREYHADTGELLDDVPRNEDRRLAQRMLVSGDSERCVLLLLLRRAILDGASR